MIRKVVLGSHQLNSSTCVTSNSANPAIVPASMASTNACSLAISWTFTTSLIPSLLALNASFNAVIKFCLPGVSRSQSCAITKNPPNSSTSTSTDSSSSSSSRGGSVLSLGAEAPEVRKNKNTCRRHQNILIAGLLCTRDAADINDLVMALPHQPRFSTLGRTSDFLKRSKGKTWRKKK